jgi:hypothetical protein
VKLVLILHPFLFTLFPIASMLAENVGQVNGVDVVRISVLSLTFVLITLIVMKRIIGSWEIASLICSGGVLLFFSYGHVYMVIKNYTLGPLLIGRHRYLVSLWLLFMITWAWFVLKKVKRYTAISRFLNVVSAGTLLLPMASLINYNLQSVSDFRSMDFQSIEVNQTQLPTGFKFPDIYYIIVDGYAREDILLELYDYDNSEFIEFLVEEGFYVAHESQSNYNQTDLSLSSSLNMTYLDFIPDSLGRDSSNKTLLHEMIEDNQVVKFLRLHGYEVIGFSSGYGPSDINSADIFWDFASNDVILPEENRTGIILNGFENLLLRSSALILLMDAPIIGKDLGLIPPEDPLYTAHRNRILYNLIKLKEIPSMDGDYFAYTHIIAPHPPFVFGSKGQWLTPPGTYTLAREGKFFTGSAEDYIKGYRGQLSYINTILVETISEILKQSSTPPMIILQADHGPGAYLDQDSNENSNMRERISILNAYYFPDRDGTGLYPSISPINSFRIVFNRIFGTDFELLEDRSYFSTVGKPFDFVLVPDDMD